MLNLCFEAAVGAASRKRGERADADALLHDMRLMQLAPDERSFALLLSHVAVLARQGRADPQDAERVVTLMRNAGIAPTAASAETHLDVLDSAAAFGHVTPAAVALVLDTMRAQNIPPTARTVARVARVAAQLRCAPPASPPLPPWEVRWELERFSGYKRKFSVNRRNSV